SVGQGADIDALGSAMNGVGARVAGLFRHLLGLEQAYDPRVSRVGLGTKDMELRQPQSPDYQLAPLRMGMPRIWAEAGAAGVSAEMVQLIAQIGHRHIADL